MVVCLTHHYGVLTPELGEEESIPLLTNRALAPPSNPGEHELLRRPWKRGEGVGVRVPDISAMAKDAPASKPTPQNALVTLRCDP